MNIKDIERAFLDQPKFRLSQAKKLIYNDFIEDWDQASVFSKDLRNELRNKIDLKIENKIFVSSDKKSAKAIILLDDNIKIETALMVHGGGRNTVCVSSQVGCPLSCSFCASGKSFRRNLDWHEIVDQVLLWSRYLKKNNLSGVSNVVFMGTGEPFLNYENVFKAIDFLHDPDFFNISFRKISISTVGITDGIRKMANEGSKVNLAVSLHFVNEDLRAKMMPITKKYPMKKLFSAIDYYIEKTNRKVMFEYMMIRGLNDSRRDAEKLIKLIKKPLYMVNIIKHNRVGDFYPSDSHTIANFKKVLGKGGVEVTERSRFNLDVEGACGQLS
jgi:23S rRNA (adenine2503-C2)-methyltransferase